MRRLWRNKQNYGVASCFDILPSVSLRIKIWSRITRYNTRVDPCFYSLSCVCSFPRAPPHIFNRSPNTLSFPYNYGLWVLKGIERPKNFCPLLNTIYCRNREKLDDTDLENLGENINTFGVFFFLLLFWFVCSQFV